MFGDYLYQLTPKDRAGLGVDLFRYKSTYGVNAANITNILQVPLDRVLILQAICLNVTPDATTNGTHAICVTGNYVAEHTLPANYMVIGNSQKALEYANWAAPYTGFVAYNWEFDGLVIPANSGLGIQASFAAAGANNTTTMFITGYTIPRGNIAF